MKSPHEKAKSPPSATKSAGAPVKPARPAQDPHRIIGAEFLAGAAPGSFLPAPICVEIAFGGRSNVGKSSLINSLVERKNLVRVSSKPGSTRQINQYEARAADGMRVHLIDLPGYGFTRRSKTEQSAWAGLIEGYLQSRVTLAVVVVLVDIRRGLEPDDQELIDFVETANKVTRRPVEVIVVATKVIGFSSETAEGRAELWRALRKASFGGEVAMEDEPEVVTDAPSLSADAAEVVVPTDQNG